MKITKIEVDRFGVWRQLNLPVSGRGLTVFYGPNEAGKTTLWRFIRSVLYGFEPFEVDLETGTPQPVRWEGALQVASAAAPYSIHRISDRGTRGLVSVVGTDRQEPAEALLAELLFRTNESLFENVFAVGLNELQELATLEDDEVAHHIYGLTLGPTGQKLLDATRALGAQSAAVFDGATRSGRLADVLEHDQSLREEHDAHLGLREEHADAAPAGLASRRGSKLSSDGGRSSSGNIPVTGCSTASGPIGTRSARSSMSWPKSPSSRVFQHAPSSGSNGWIRNSSLSHRGAISCRRKWPRSAIDIAAWRRHETSISMRRDWPASSSTPAGIATRPNKRRLPAPRRASAGSGSTAPSRIWARDGRPLDWSGSTRARPRTAGCSLRRTVFARRCVDVIDWPAAKSF